MEYLLKASAVIFIFYVCYKLFLQRETFFESNRWFLLIGLFIAATLPFIVIPIYIEYVPVVQQFIVTNDGTVTQTAIKNSFNWAQILYLVYSIGALFFLVKLGIEFSSLLLMLKKNTIHKKGTYTFVETENNVPPFSFFKYIVYNKKQFNETELNYIINHEKAHARQYHSIDILLIQLASAVFWFNPFIWLYKKELQQNLEFIADKEAQTISNCEKSYQNLLLKASVPNYQLTLANNFYNSLTRLTLFGKPIAIGKPLGQVKKRIVMLHKSKSNKLNVWKYALVLPVLALFLMSANTKEIYVEKTVSAEHQASLADPSVENEITNVLNSTDQKENISKASNELKNTDSKKEQPKKVPSNEANSPKIAKTIGDHEMAVIKKDFTDADLEALKSQLKEKGITIKFKGIKRNSDNEITAIKIDVSSKKSNANYHTESDNAIRPIKIGFDSEGGSLSIGNSGESHSGKYFFSAESKDGNHKIHTVGNADYVFVIEDNDNDDDEHDEKTVIRKADKVHQSPKTKGKVHFVSEDDHVTKIEDKNIIISESGDVDTIHVKRLNKANAIWVTKTDNTKVYAFENNRDNKLSISTIGEKTPLFILNGKEISKKEMDELKQDSIEKIEVLKGDSATEKYGEKGKDGVILITTKDEE